jgi:hypothetical protein
VTGRDGFRVMDVSTDIHNDPKWRRIARIHPEQSLPAFASYVALLAESWKKQERLVLDEDVWPIWFEYDANVVSTMVEVGLLGKDRRITRKAWAAWVEPVLKRISDKRYEGAVNGLVSHGWSRPAAITEINHRMRSTRGTSEVAKEGPGLSSVSPRPVRTAPAGPAAPGRADPARRRRNSGKQQRAVAPGPLTGQAGRNTKDAADPEDPGGILNGLKERVSWDAVDQKWVGPEEKV